MRNTFEITFSSASSPKHLLVCGNLNKTERNAKVIFGLNSLKIWCFFLLLAILKPLNLKKTGETIISTHGAVCEMNGLWSVTPRSHRCSLAALCECVCLRVPTCVFPSYLLLKPSSLIFHHHLRDEAAAFNLSHTLKKCVCVQWLRLNDRFKLYIFKVMTRRVKSTTKHPGCKRQILIQTHVAFGPLNTHTHCSTLQSANVSPPHWAFLYFGASLGKTSVFILCCKTFFKGF